MSNQESLAEKIYQISILQQNYVLQRFKELQLNSLQARSISYIFHHQGSMQRELAEYLGKKQATVTNILKGLEKRNVVYRKIPKNNERQKNIFLTTDGEQVAHQVSLIFKELDEKICNGLTQEEQDMFQLNLTKVETKFFEN
ncbi:hypothetical protein A5821_000812 [Enterococcus sp. 7F3_DIV0205]|uniref:HTH marR-type domain-containing protein n=1 Tax=Candidatus Enterococcus palustris TaxID=1834189 RepID=A0AAQ3WC95_9ENTE|nr:MarR family winged helix-turn-helix transcriptional regulator [Enterococcus sp. 7F3_DIV0205]OTN85227.1 hypothetical protein A5821_001156 [Enterococcus sp. 7F3_DIV0205]